MKSLLQRRFDRRPYFLAAAMLITTIGVLSMPTTAGATTLTVPGAPTGVIASPGNSQAKVQWAAPASTGGSPITGYTVTASPGGKSATATGTSATIAGLTNGTAYTFAVKAKNKVGTSTSSILSAKVTPAAPPSVPLSVKATAGDTRAVVSWTAPLCDGGAPVTGYTVVSSPGGITATTTGARSVTVNGLTNDVAYSFTVTAHNAASTSAPSVASAAATPEGKPPVVTGLVVTGVDDRTVQLEWNPVIVGSPASSYTVTSQPGNIIVTSTTAAASVPGLDYGVAYTFTVVATNSYGSADPSAPSAPVTPARAPDPVINLHATAGDGQATITWEAPAFDGGSPITSYTIDAWSDGITMTVSGDARSATVTGLTNGITYEFLVIPSNVRGATLSAWSNPVVPVSPPVVVAGLVVTVVGDGMVRLEWNPALVAAPASSYTVTSLPDNRTFTTTDAFLDIYGLTNGVPYTFTVVANSPLGNAAPSAPVGATPAV